MRSSVDGWTGGASQFSLVAAGANINVDALLLAYTAGVLASNIPLLPAGLGVVETVTPVSLTHYGFLESLGSRRP